jgi:magnesium-transporting ATPase (P-type)
VSFCKVVPKIAFCRTPPPTHAHVVYAPEEHTLHFLSLTSLPPPPHALNVFFSPFFLSAATKIAVVPFESEHKWQAVLVKDGSVPGGRVLHLKGAPERTFPMCQSSVTGDSVTAPSVPLDAPFWEAKAAEMSSKGLRVLACARWCPPVDWDASQLSVAWLAAGPPRLTLVGLIAILDPPPGMH